MSQKQACAIFATSFLAGLLVTAVVFQPFSIAPTTTPYFGFPGESEDLSAQNDPAVLEPGTTSQPSLPQVTEVVDVSTFPNELAESFSDTIREHLLPLGEIPTTTISFPQAVMLSTEEILSLENLAKRADNGSVSVTAFNGIPASETTDSLQPFGIDTSVADSGAQLVRSPVTDDSSEKEAQPALDYTAGKSEANAVDIGTSVAAEKQKSLASNDGSTHLETKQRYSTPQPTADRLPKIPLETQGHVSATTNVDSPDSLRSLVSRTQTVPQNQPKIEDKNTVPAQKSSQGQSDAVVKGLQAAAVALDKTEKKVPVQSLLTRTLGQSATRTPPAKTSSSKATYPSKTETTLPLPSVNTKQRLQPVSAESAKSLTSLPQPKRWEKNLDVRLTPRYARPHTENAPSPPLQLEQAGNPLAINPKKVNSDQHVSSDKSWVNLDEGTWSEATTSTEIESPAPSDTPRERIVKRLSAERKATALPPPPNPPLPASNPLINTKETSSTEPPPEPTIKRIIERLRPGERLRDRIGQNIKRFEMTTLATATSPITAWPPPEELLRKLDELAADGLPRPSSYKDIRKWVDQTTSSLSYIMTTRGPHDLQAIPAIITLDQCFDDAMVLADSLSDINRATQIRRAAFAVKRRTKTWHAAAILAEGLTEKTADERKTLNDISSLLASLEAFETNSDAVRATEVRQALAVVERSELLQFETLRQAVIHHYAAPNFRVALDEVFLTRLMPESPSRTETVRDVILGKPVRGRRVVEQITSVNLTPDADEICFDLTVDGQVSTYAITETGPIALTSRGSGQFTVKKPMRICREGLIVGQSVASASNRARLMNVSTSFDSVPLMGSLLRTLARNQHADSLPEANREVAQKIVWQSCRQTDQESEKKFAVLSDQIEDSFWQPLVRLGLSPTPFMETTEDRATLRLRLNADTQLAAHTPRPREPDGTLFGYQVHESTINNAFERLGIKGQRLALEELFIHVQQQLGLEEKIPEDLPEGVSVAFEQVEPIRVDFDQGLVQVKISIDALESGRRNWYDVIGSVTYKPVASGNSIVLKREGPIRISGPGHRGRIEFTLRTIFGKIFPKERPVPIVPKKFTDHPRLQNLTTLQAMSWDGWVAIALGDTPQLQTAETLEEQPTVIR